MPLPLIDVGPLLADPDGTGAADVTRAIDDACRRHGFFVIVGHGIDEALLEGLDVASRRFFALDDATKAQISMARGGRAWRGWFPVGDELTSGQPDGKEGIYYGVDLDADDPRVRAGVPLHGTNPASTDVPELLPLVRRFIDEMTALGHVLMGAVATGLGLDREHFRQTITTDPVVLFRIFHYPMHDPAVVGPAWGVGEHTDYGLLTLLHQDDLGGLEVKTPDGWIEATPVPGSFVCNIGDMLARLSEGRYRSTAHRVRPPAGDRQVGRLSFPFFFDPSWDASVPGLEGTYGDYLTAKVAAVFPELFRSLDSLDNVSTGAGDLGLE